MLPLPVAFSRAPFDEQPLPDAYVRILSLHVPALEVGIYPVPPKKGRFSLERPLNRNLIVKHAYPNILKSKNVLLLLSRTVRGRWSANTVLIVFVALYPFSIDPVLV